MAARVHRLVPRRRRWSAPGWCSTGSCRRLKRYLAYLPEGPVLDWAAPRPRGAGSTPMADHLQGRRAPSAIRMGPPVVVRPGLPTPSRRRSPTTPIARLGDVPPDSGDDVGGARAGRRCARRAGDRWPPTAASRAGQPQYVFQVPLAGRTEDDLLAGMNQLWRRNIKKAAKARRRGHAGHARTTCRRSTTLYAETAQRDRFTPRPLSYFQQMFDALAGRGPRPHPALPRPPRRRPGRGDDVGPGRHAHLVLLRRLLDRQARRARLQRDPVADDQRRASRPAPTSTTCAASPTPSTPTTRTSD